MMYNEKIYKNMKTRQVTDNNILQNHRTSQISNKMITQKQRSYYQFKHISDFFTNRCVVLRHQFIKKIIQIEKPGEIKIYVIDKQTVITIENYI